MKKTLLIALSPIFAFIHVLMRYFEWGAKGLGRVNDWYLDQVATPLQDNNK